MADQMPFHFADPLDPRIDDYLERTRDTVYAPDVLRRSSTDGFGQIDLEGRLALVSSAHAGAERALGPGLHRGGRGGDRGRHRGAPSSRCSSAAHTWRSSRRRTAYLADVRRFLSADR